MVKKILFNAKQGNKNPKTCIGGFPRTSLKGPAKGTGASFSKSKFNWTML